MALILATQVASCAFEGWLLSYEMPPIRTILSPAGATALHSASPGLYQTLLPTRSGLISPVPLVPPLAPPVPPVPAVPPAPPVPLWHWPVEEQLCPLPQLPHTPPQESE